MTNNKPYANNEPNNHDVKNSAPKAFAGRNEPSSFSQIPQTCSCLLNLEQNHTWGPYYSCQ